ncbi:MULTISPECIES: phosphate/phosphite/phosphonate ABC transporter substrate-binding protein [unclassified Haladaptatus]|uniref:phosphate/phosphite/phosphonate ABC transporter substrate-binding protein n=1 Tax=unclassified Haladaptatus TaxID=2622732 RepID=UPI00209C4968|nr:MULTISPECIES: phosphate/phosphite/phosphonate ABC transporter substrate-binding protein [unclassified Haladaptatus]MCO8242824.1 phosphate/phosphite/phosphonate ABC transporter substrate-binding protein [Haladaptatus sp. AB643]MCO8252584.1 phosphate/phosphite/phosphonate ABC transporter substrate-binding protein [Haladaptatus sp. AB618]
MVNRRTFIKSASTAGLVGLSGMAGCIGTFGKQAYKDGKIKFLMSPTEPQEQMMAQYTPIKKRLNNYIDAVDTVNMKYAANYSATLTALDSGTADVAESGPFAAALGVKNDRADIILQRHAYGTWTYYSVIITREDSDISSLKDLKGKKIAFADALSASGSLYPLSMLKEAGLSIPDSPGDPKGADFEPTWTTHDKAYNALKSGQADAAGVGRFIVWDYDTNDYVEGVKELDIRSEIPRAPIMVSPKLTDDEKEKITKAFTKAPDKMYYGADGKKDTDDDIWFDGVKKVDASTYQPVVKVANKLGYGEDIFKN